MERRTDDMCQSGAKKSAKPSVSVPDEWNEVFVLVVQIVGGSSAVSSPVLRFADGAVDDVRIRQRGPLYGRQWQSAVLLDAVHRQHH